MQEKNSHTDVPEQFQKPGLQLETPSRPKLSRVKKSSKTSTLVYTIARPLSPCMLFTEPVSKMPSSTDHSDSDGITNTVLRVCVILIFHAVESQFERNTEELALPKKSPKKRKKIGEYSSGQ